MSVSNFCTTSPVRTSHTENPPWFVVPARPCAPPPSLTPGPVRGAGGAAQVLHDFHEEHGGKMVDFAGYSMPIQYKDSIMESTKHCRVGASLFDVSHMCPISLTGKDAIPFIHKVVTLDVGALADGTGSLSVMPNAEGGIVDDTVVVKMKDDHVYMVLNAGCREKDLAHIGKILDGFDGDVSLHVHDEMSLLALQGPKAAPALQTMTDEDLSKLYFGMLKEIDVMGVKCKVMRTGYTGEDGFEISMPVEDTLAFTKELLTKDGVILAGLGARDSLRLEAGLCLYGNDIDETTTPMEGGLTWCITKSRRETVDPFGFTGGAVIKQKLEEGFTKRRVGFIVGKGAPARAHSKVLSEDGEEIGEVTSGGFSPNLGQNIAMGYVKKGFHKAGTPIKIQVRKKINDAVVAKMPFVPCTYYRPS